VWKDDIHDGKIVEVVRLAPGGFSDLAELKPADESTTVLRIARNEPIFMFGSVSFKVK
jgi:hypothetical protein